MSFNSIFHLFCQFTPEQKKIIKKNPHTLKFFCHIDNIIILNKKKINYLKNGYYYKKEFKNEPLNSSNINFQLIKHLYFQNIIRLKIDDNFPKLSFEPTKQRPTSVLHFGQLKLFSATLQFFNIYIPKNKEVHILYPGSAPGNNIYLLSKLYPNCYWYLIDPSPFYNEIKKNKNFLHISNNYFTSDQALEFKKKLKNKYTVFICDIRNINMGIDGLENREFIINTDMENQYNWCKSFNADISSLKFRIPVLKDIEYKYFEGEIYIQPFASEDSTETRLICKKNAKDKIYNKDDYESKLYYHNRIFRVCNYNKLHNYKYKYFCNCYDCSLFFITVQNYLNKFNSKLSFNKFIKFILKHFANSYIIKNKYDEIIKKIV